MATTPYVCWQDERRQGGRDARPGRRPGEPVDRPAAPGLVACRPERRVRPAFLIHQDNPALGTLLEILGAVEDADPGAGHGNRRALESARLRPVPDDAGDRRHPIPIPNQALVAYDQATPPSATLTGPLVPVGPGGVVVLASAPTVQLTIPAAPGPAVDVTLTLAFDHLALFGQTIGLTGVTVAIRCDPATGAVAVNGVPLNAGSVNSTADRVDLGGKLALVFDPDDPATAAGRVPSFDLPIGAGHYTHQPLINGLDGSAVTVAWTTLVVRLRGDR